MSEVRPTTRSERLRWLILARLLPKMKRSITRRELRTDVAACVSAKPGAELRDAVDAAIERCLADGWIAARPLALTAEGREALRAALNVERLPAPKDWGHVRRNLLVDLSLGRALARGKRKESEQLAAEILVAHHALPDHAPSLRAVVDRLAWRALGVETNARFDAARVQRHLLRDIVAEDARVDLETWRRLLAVRAAGAKSASARDLRAALLERWLREAPSNEPTPAASETVTSDNDNDESVAPSLAQLARAVDEAARDPGVARFHDDRAFIGSLWEHMQGRPPIGSMSLADFKQQLVAAHRAGLLRITRADLVGAMDPAEVQRSEATYMGATFHFVALDAVGSR